MTHPDEVPPIQQASSAYDAYWTASEADLDVPLPKPPAAPPPTEDTYAAFHQAADE
jgi:hypothetical protein